MQANQAAQGLKSLGLQLHQGSSLVTYVYIKRQKAQGGVDAERTTAAAAAHALYVTGLPLGLDEASLQAIFQLFGEVVDVVMHPSKVSSDILAGVSPVVSRRSSLPTQHPLTNTAIASLLLLPPHSAQQQWCMSQLRVCQRP